ncbi:hypothetical protein LZ554_004661 [Drepanopeziza brunnea f. sp. 'monogermtubi']|nr:hypothetical protein LZ554_004661 [Drepanopeziza brunnea f. sp. 'monogermtubi']
MENHTAAQRVLATPEILEIILLPLSHVDLLVRANPVNHTFHNTISTSPPIQKRLFFLPAMDGTVRGPCPFLRARGRVLKHVDYRRGHTIETDKKILSIRWEEYTDFSGFDYCRSSPEKKAAVERKEASWRKMLAVQPPIRQLTIFPYDCWIGSGAEDAEWLRMDAFDTGGETWVGIKYHQLVIHRDGQGKIIQTGDMGGC